jgi:hypothetical protein
VIAAMMVTGRAGHSTIADRASEVLGRLLDGPPAVCTAIGVGGLPWGARSKWSSLLRSPKWT